MKQFLRLEKTTSKPILVVASLHLCPFLGSPVTPSATKVDLDLFFYNGLY